MDVRYWFDRVRATTRRVLQSLKSPVAWLVRKFRKEEQWRDPKNLDAEIAEIVRVERFEQANPRATEDQQTDARRILYQVRRPTWTYRPGVEQYDGRYNADGKDRRPNVVWQQAWLGSAFIELPLECTPVPVRIQKRLKALPRLNTDQSSPKKQPVQDKEFRDGQATSSPAVGRKIHRKHRLSPETATPATPTSLRWPIEKPKIQTSPLKVFFEGVAQTLEESDLQSESWSNVDID